MASAGSVGVATGAVTACAATGVPPLEGSGRARVRRSSCSCEERTGCKGEEDHASNGPARKASVSAGLAPSGIVATRPARASMPSAERKLAMPPCFGWLVITATWGLPSRICVANTVSARFGPTSTKAPAPAAAMVSIWAVHSTDEAICGASFSSTAALASSPSIA